MERYGRTAGSFLKYHYRYHLGLTVLFVVAAGAVLSFRNLDAAGAAKVMEMYGILSGILLFVPLFMPEADTEIWLLEKSKAMSMWSLYLERLLAAVLVLAVVISSFIFRLSLGGSVFEAGAMWWISFCEALFLGGIGFFASAVTNQVIIGYMLSIIYFVGNIGGAKYFGRFGLFPAMRMQEDGMTGFWFLAGGMLLFVLGIRIRERKR